MSDQADIEERTFGDVTIKIDRDACIGSGNCTKVAPEVFELDDELVATFRDAETGEIDREKLIEAARVCPVYALYAINAQGEQEAPEGRGSQALSENDPRT
jgi:ferredoxin